MTKPAAGKRRMERDYREHVSWGMLSVRSRLYLISGMLILFFTSALLVVDCRAEVTADQVREAIRRGVRFLKRARNPNKGWPEYVQEPGGLPALCTLALLSSGLDTKDPDVAASLRELRNLGNPSRTYSTSLQTMVFAQAEPDRDRLLIRRNVEYLEASQHTEGPLAGGWSYFSRSSPGQPDQSNTQFALLALHEAALVGVPVKRRTWELAAQYWQTQQNVNGSWGYRGSPPTGSMTCAGIASVIICNFHLRSGDAAVINGQVECCLPQESEASVEKGLAWLASHFSVARNPSDSGSREAPWHHYYLYGLERVGRLSGRRFIGRHDWYREGAEYLVKQQNALDGSWSSGGSQKELSTSMALLFLAKGKRPVIVSKLKHSQGADWNRHRQGVANLTMVAERRWKQPLAWQTIDLQHATTEDLLQSPVLFLSGKQALTLTATQKRTLYDYLNQGGFLFAEAACGGADFDRSFRELMRELFPENPLRLLPPDHPIWYAEQRVPPEHMRPLYGIDSCCRTSVVYCPKDLGCYWELVRQRAVPYPVDVQAEVEGVLIMGMNVLAYATGRELRDKLDIPLVPIAESGTQSSERGSLAVVKLQHSGGSDDAPAALSNLLRIASAQAGMTVDQRRYLMSATASELAEYPVAFVHGRRSFQWSQEERASIRQFVLNGGFLFADAICGNPEFAESFRQEMKLIFPDRTWKRIPPQHAMFTSEYRGYDILQVRLHRPDARSDADPLSVRTETVTPLLEGLEFDGLYCVVFSPYDLSCALENYSSLECLGYIREDAAKIGINILLYALQQ